MLAGVLIVSGVLSVGLGPVRVPPGEVVRMLVHRVFPGAITPDWPSVHETILFDLRVPRVILAVVAGAGLSVAGAVLQALVRNPLGDPTILGVTEGASVGATVVILIGLDRLGRFTLPAGAFAGSLGALLLVYGLARGRGRLSALRLVLAGVAISYLLNAITSFLVFQSTPSSSGITRVVLFWIMGGLGGAEWSLLGLPAVVVAVTVALLTLRSRSLNALLAGDETATSLGVDVSGFRKELLVATALLTGSVTAVAGGIGFVGLMVPHVVRRLVGSNHFRVLPASALLGGAVLVWADVVARTAFAPEEIPIGVVTAFLGAPFFIWLMKRRGAGAGGVPE